MPTSKQCRRQVGPPLSLALVIAIWSAAPVLHAQPLEMQDSVRDSAAAAARLAPNPPALTPVTEQLPVPATSTRLDFFEAAAEPSGGLTVTWRTIYERGVVAFELHRRSADGQWTLVNPVLIAASNHITGAVYRVADPGATAAGTVTYQLVEWDEACVRHAMPALTLPVAAEPTSLGHLLPPPPRRDGKSLWSAEAPPPPLGDGPRYTKFVTTQAGLHFVRADTIAGLLEVDEATVRDWLSNGTVGLYSRGQTVGYVPGDDGGSLFFYATAYGDNYTSQNVFWLTSLTNATPAVIPAGQPEPVTGIFDHAVFRQETNAIATPTVTHDPESDYWFWRRIFSTPGFNTWALSVPLTQVVTSAGAPSLTVWFHGGSATNHGAGVLVNGQHVGGAFWSGTVPAVLQAQLQPAWLNSGANTFVFSVSNLPVSQVFLNKLELRYPRLYRAAAGTLEFTANSNAVVTVEGFTSDALSVLEVTDPVQPAVVTDFTVAGGPGNYTLSLAPERPDARYVAFQANATLPQPAASAVTLAGLADPTNAFDFVLIAPAFLAAASEELAEYRRGEGLRSRVVTTESIYDEFNYGLPSPHALREFLRYAHTNWAARPRYVVFIGDGSFDYRNLLGQNSMQVPSLMVDTPQGLFVSDTVIGDFTGDTIPEVIIGRLPTRNAAQLQTVINKIRTYEAQGVRSEPKALLLADFADSGGNFPLNIGFVGLNLSNKYAQQVIYPSTATAMRTAVINGLNAGQDLMVYLGHGAINRLGQAGYLRIEDIPSLNNGHRLPLLTAMTCVAGEFSQPSANCLAEELVLAANRGAIAVIAPTGFSENPDATLLNQRLMRVLRSEDWGRLGDFWRQAAEEYVYFDNRYMGVSIYNLIGDPTLHFAVRRPPPPPRAK